MDFVTFDIAKKLKEKGFKEKCYAYYFPKGSELIFNHTPFRGSIIKDCLYSNNSLSAECIARDFIDAPTISQVLKWLREDKVISVEPYASASGWRVTICRAYHQDRCDAGGGTCLKREVIGYNDGGAFEKYEEAALAGIEYVIDNLI